MELVDSSLQRAKGSYRTCVEIIHQIHLNNINPSERTEIKKYIENDFLTDEETFRTSIENALA